jgi:hypothetical protein
MKWLEILVHTIVFIIAFAGIFYVIPKVIIPDVIQEIKKVFYKHSGQRIEVATGYKKKKKLWDTQNTYDKLA